MTEEDLRKMSEWCGEERRVSHESWIGKLELTLEKVATRLGFVENFQGQAKIAYAILMAVFIGGFFYTYNHKQDAIREYDKIAANTKEIGKLEGKLLVVEDRYTRLLSDIENLSNNLSAYAKEARMLNKIQRVEIENYKTQTSNPDYEGKVLQDW